MNVSYTADGKARLANNGFATSAVRDEAFAALQAQLGPSVVSTVKAYHPVQAAVELLISLGILGAIFFVMYQSALEAAAGAEAQTRGRAVVDKLLFVGVLNLLGPTGVLLRSVLFNAQRLWLVANVVFEFPG